MTLLENDDPFVTSSAVAAAYHPHAWDVLCGQADLSEILAELEASGLGGHDLVIRGRIAELYACLPNHPGGWTKAQAMAENTEMMFSASVTMICLAGSRLYEMALAYVASWKPRGTGVLALHEAVRVWTCAGQAASQMPGHERLASEYYTRAKTLAIILDLPFRLSLIEKAEEMLSNTLQPNPEIWERWALDPTQSLSQRNWSRVTWAENLMMCGDYSTALKVVNNPTNISQANLRTFLRFLFYQEEGEITDVSPYAEIYKQLVAAVKELRFPTSLSALGQPQSGYAWLLESMGWLRSAELRAHARSRFTPRFSGPPDQTFYYKALVLAALALGLPLDIPPYLAIQDCWEALANVREPGALARTWAVLNPDWAYLLALTPDAPPAVLAAAATLPVAAGRQLRGSGEALTTSVSIRLALEEAGIEHALQSLRPVERERHVERLAKLNCPNPVRVGWVLKACKALHANAQRAKDGQLAEHWRGVLLEHWQMLVPELEALDAHPHFEAWAKEIM